MKIDFNKKWVDLGRVVSFTEALNDNGDKLGYYELNAMIVPFEKISRNKVLYDTESIKKTHKILEGKPMMYNHITSGNDVYPRGEWEAAYIKEDGMYGKGRVFDTSYNTHLIEYLKHAKNPHVSLQISGQAESMQSEDGTPYRKAYINDWVECSIVPTEGFVQAKAQLGTYLAENLNTETEDNTMANSDDILTTKIIKKKDNSEDEESDEYYKKLKEILHKYK